MITYKTTDDGFAAPILHTIHFRNHERSEVFKWCKENCKARFYTAPDWHGDMVQFEDDDDAIWFALRWG